MALSVGDVVRTAVHMLLGNGVEYVNVYHHIFDGIGGISDAAVVSDINDWVEAAYAELAGYTETAIVEQLSFVDEVAWNGTKWATVRSLGTFTPAFAPAGGSDITPNQVSAFVTFKTERPKSVGRKFMFPALDGAQNAGLMSGPYVTAMVAFADIVVNDITLDIANGLVPGVPRTAVDDWLTFTVAVVTNLLGTQRRRRPGYGS